MINIRAMWRKVFGVLFFKDVGVFSVFEWDRGRDVGLRDGVDLDVGEFKSGVNGSFKLSDIDDSESEELILRMDMPRRQNSRETATMGTLGRGWIGRRMW